MAELSDFLGGTGLKLAPDLTYGASTFSANLDTTVSAVDASAGLTEILALSGRFVVSAIYMNGITTDDLTRVKLTIDGVVIWDGVPAGNGSSTNYFIGAGTIRERFLVESSLSFEVQTATDTSINLIYNARPIL